MEIFYAGWSVVQQVFAADAKMPREVALPRPHERQVAKYIVDRREFSVREVVEAIAPLSQPELLEANQKQADLVERRKFSTETAAVNAPVSRQV